MKKNRELLINTIIYSIGNLGTKLLSFLIVPLYTYYISPEMMGEYDLLITTVSLVTPLVTMRIFDATYRWIIRNSEITPACIAATYRAYLGNCFIFTLIVLAINAVYPIWNCWYFILLLVLHGLFECMQKILRGLLRQKLYVFSGILYSILFLGQNFVQICFLNQGVEALLRSSAISYALVLAIMILSEKRLLSFASIKRDRSLQREMLQFSIPLVPESMCWWIMSASDRYIIRFFLGGAANGIFSVAHKFPSILQMMFTMFNNAWVDLVLSQVKRDGEEQYISQVFKMLYKVMLGFAIILIPMTKLVMQLVLSPAYKEASIYIGFLYLGTVFQGFSSFCSVGYLYDKKTSGMARTSLWGALANVAVHVLLVRYMGLFAAAISTFTGFFVMWIIRMRDMKSSLKITFNKLEFSLYVFTAICVSIAIIYTPVIADCLITLSLGICFLFDNKKIIGIATKKLKQKMHNLI